MVSLPVLSSLSLRDYALFPQIDESEILFDFGSGLTILLGANGIGKSTLVSILFRLLVGPAELKGGAREVFGGRVENSTTSLEGAARRFLASRVPDAATAATGTLVVKLGSANELSVTRRLRDLTLVSAELSPDGLLVTTEDEYQALVVAHSGVSSFADWLLLMRYVSFVQEPRRTAFWDDGAQRQVLRAAILPGDLSRTWVDAEAEYLSAESDFRNLKFILGRLQRRISENESAAEGVDDIGARLREVESELSEVTGVLKEADEAFGDARTAYESVEAEFHKQGVRLAVARSDYEAAKAEVISGALPDLDSTQRYLVSRLGSGALCFACGRAVASGPRVHAEGAHEQCVVCGGGPTGQSVPADQSDQEEPALVHRVLSRLQDEILATDAAREDLEDASATYERVARTRRTANERYAQLDSERSRLIAALPADEDTRKLKQERSEYRTELDLLEASLDPLRTRLRALAAEASEKVVAVSERIRDTCERYARAFLVEDVRLIWSTEDLPVGQLGVSVPFPRFKLEMTGNASARASTRATAQDVSESQREFVDMAFRLAIIAVAADQQAATMVFDAPDASVDAVFEEKAADTIAEYAGQGRGQRAIVTANLATGDFVPRLCREYRRKRGSEASIVNLLDFAAPTAATTKYAKEYAVALRNVLDRAARDVD